MGPFLFSSLGSCSSDTDRASINCCGNTSQQNLSVPLEDFSFLQVTGIFRVPCNVGTSLLLNPDSLLIYLWFCIVVIDTLKSVCVCVIIFNCKTISTLLGQIRLLFFLQSALCSQPPCVSSSVCSHPPPGLTATERRISHSSAIEISMHSQ